MARKPADATKILSRRVLVIIDRDMTAKTPRVVWQHEIPILESVFGEGNVTPVDASKLDEGFSNKVSPDLLPFNKLQDAVLKPSESNGIDWVFVGDPRTEYDRLGALYGNLPEENRLHVEAVYGRFQDGRFAGVVGSAEVEDLPEPQLRDLIKGYGFIPTLGQDSTDAERAEARSKQVTLNTASQTDLVKIAEELGVSIN